MNAAVPLVPDRAVPLVAVVPLRSPGVGKTRLAPTLTVEERAALAGAMLADVLAALRAAPLDRIIVAAGGPAAAAAAAALGVEVVSDPATLATSTSSASRLDAALAAAASRLGGPVDLLIVAADLPRLTGDAVTRLVAEDAEVVVAPTRDGGTGGLLRRPADACATAYGAGSAARHASLARAAGRRTAVLDLPGFRDDVDVAADLDRLRSRLDAPLGPCTAAVLARLGPDAATG
jgi:2-phospho-L-lactate/phosphoenolpyruvate guanylyltransferase